MERGRGCPLTSLEPRTSDRALVLGEGFLGELARVLDLVEGFLGELKLVLVIIEFFCLLDQQLWLEPCFLSLIKLLYSCNTVVKGIVFLCIWLSGTFLKFYTVLYTILIEKRHSIFSYVYAWKNKFSRRENKGKDYTENIFLNNVQNYLWATYISSTNLWVSA